MTEQWVLSFVQSLRWILAGMAGAAFSKYDLLNSERSIWYKVGFLIPTILMLAGADYLVRFLLL